jgi:hypothetical protein
VVFRTSGAYLPDSNKKELTVGILATNYANYTNFLLFIGGEANS